MTYFISAFDVEAADQHEERKAARHSTIYFNQRAAQRFEGFLRQAAHQDEFGFRLRLVGDDLAKLAAECGTDEGAVTAFIDRIAGGAFCDDCKKWKSGPKAGTCECADGESKGTKDDLLADAPSAVSSKTANPLGYGDDGQSQMTCDHCGQPVDALSTHGPCPHCGQMSGSNTLGDLSQQMGDAFFGGGQGRLTSERTAEDALGGKGTPSPKMDKSNAGDEKGNKHREPIDTDGGRYKTVAQDVADTAEYDNEDFLEQTETVTDHGVDVTKGSETSGETGPHTDTWSGTAGLADPVTSSFLSSTTISQAIAAFEG